MAMSGFLQMGEASSAKAVSRMQVAVFDLPTPPYPLAPDFRSDLVEGGYPEDRLVGLGE